MVAEPESSTPLIPKSATGQDPESLQSPSIVITISQYLTG